MPILKPYPRPFDSLWRSWDAKARKEGLRHAVIGVNKTTYIGEWHDDTKHGQGRQDKPTGLRYEGSWKYGKVNGYGALSKPDGNGLRQRLYTGYFQDGKRHGDGTELLTDGSRYEGSFEEGRRSGWGKMFYADGAFYEGQWKDGFKHGIGILLMSNGVRYEGEWKRGLRHGKGEFFMLHSGQALKGVWEDGVMITGDITDLDRQAATCPTPYPLPELRVKQDEIRYEDLPDQDHPEITS